MFCTVNIDYFVNRKIDTYDIYGGAAHLQGSVPLVLTWRSSGVVMAVRWRNSCFVWNILDRSLFCLYSSDLSIVPCATLNNYPILVRPFIKGFYVIFLFHLYNHIKK